MIRGTPKFKMIKVKDTQVFAAMSQLPLFASTTTKCLWKRSEEAVTLWQKLSCHLLQIFQKKFKAILAIIVRNNFRGIYYRRNNLSIPRAWTHREFHHQGIHYTPNNRDQIENVPGILEVTL